MNNNILVIETALNGHRGLYLKWVVESFLENGNKVVVALPKEYANDPSIYGLKNQNLNFELYDKNLIEKNKWLDKLGLFGRDLQNYLKFKALYKKCSRCFYINFVFIPFVDHILYSAAIFGSPFGKCRFSGISMRPDFHYQKFGLKVPDRGGAFIKALIFKKFVGMRNLNCILTLDEPLYLYCKNLHRSNVKFLPEPAEAVEVDSEMITKLAGKLGIDISKRQILVFGSLTSRKGIVELVDSSIELAKLHNLQFVFAGKADEAMRDYFCSAECKALIEEQKVVLIDRFISENEQSVLFSCAYICWLGYIDHHRASGVLITSAKYAVPVIATNQGVIGWQVDRNELGLVININIPEEISSALVEMCTNTDVYTKCIENAKGAFLDNTLDNAKRIVSHSMAVTDDARIRY